jgi:predicted Zn-dependent peptidase
MRLSFSAASALIVAALIAGPAAQAPDRSTPPAVGPAPSLKLPAVQKRRLANGLPVWIVEMHEVPVVQVDLLVLSGSADDPSGKYGIATLTAAMLQEGAGSRSALDIADAIDYLGADLTTTSGIDSAVVGLHTPVARLADALPVMADVALRPTFPKEELERLRQQRLTNIVQTRDNPDAVASLVFARVLFGSAHRFGTSVNGTTDTLRAFTVDDLRAFYASRYRPDNAAMLIVGDITPEKALPLVESSFGRWTPAGAGAARVKLQAPGPRVAREVYVVDRPGAAQSQIRIGAVAVARSSPDYFPLQVLNTVLGGAFSSRLNLNLREKHGYTYGANSIFDMRVAEGPFIAAAGVQTDKTSESLKEFFNELNGILQPVPADELARTKNYIALRFPGTFETTGDISRRLEDEILYRLPDDYFSKYVQNIQAVTAADVQRVAMKYLAPDRMAVVVVGDQKVVEPDINALNIGPIKTMTAIDVLGQ